MAFVKEKFHYEASSLVAMSAAEADVSSASGSSDEPRQQKTLREERISLLYWASRELLTNDESSAGLPEDEYLRRCAEVTTLELFMNSLPNPEHLTDFVNLRELAIHLEPMPRVVGLSGMQQLQRLCMTETGLCSLNGLEACSSLTHLDCSHNRLTEMESSVLRHLSKLRTLWLNDNTIGRLKGLEGLSALTTLWLGCNRIDAVGDALTCNQNLEDLNLAGNLLANFKDVPTLGRMRKLTKIAMSEPHFGENPLCSLCNYQTYVLFHMPQLQQLDSMLVTDELRALAEATYMKKKMYYNMRIKTLKRNTSNVLRKATEVRQTKISQINLNLNVLLRQAKDVERELHDSSIALASSGGGGSSGGEPAAIGALRRKLDVLMAGIEAKTREIEEIEARLAALKSLVCETSQTSICRLMVELETGGNIRLEDGKPADVWYMSCVDLVTSRFVAADYAELGIGGLRVTRVTRIHNRHLRNQFEQRLEELVSTADGSYKRSLEYLFYAEPPEMPGELARTMEDGFRDVESYRRPCGHSAVPLSNSVALCDLPRLTRQVNALPLDERTALLAGQPPARHAPHLHAQLLITKVFLSRCAQEKGGAPAGAAGGDFKGDDEADRAPIKRADYNGFASVYRASSRDPKQRRWFVFEPALVLPEYLVELEYLPTQAKAERDPSASQLAELGGGLGANGVPSDAEAIDLANLTRPLLRFVQQCSLASAADPYDAECTAALNMPPLLPPRGQLEATGMGQLLQQTSGADWAKLEVLNLHGSSLRQIEGLGELPQLRTLVLCFNEIARIEGLDGCRNLEQLDLGFNLIKRIEGLKGVPALRILELNNNLIYRLDDVTVLAKYVPLLAALSLRNNAVCEVKSYRPHLLAQLPKLSRLDGVSVESKRQSASSIANATCITPALIRAHAYHSKRYSYSLRPNTLAEGRDDGSSSGAPDPPASSDGTSPWSAAGATNGADGDGGPDGWWRHVEELELNHQHLHKLQGLDKLVNLRRASFCDNALTRLEGLERCVALEELSLEDNRICKLENLSGLKRLTKLDLGKNRITHVEGLEGLNQLSQLSLEDNDISSLAPLAKLLSLMELYIGNNRLVALKDVQQLKELPKLIILDLSGNPLCEASDYRSYTIYQVRKLKVLDGVGIESAEQSSAREKFAGRLTTEHLVEKLGHSFWQHVRELDLSRSKLRELDALHADGFANLRELNLDGNAVSSLATLPKLPALTVLRLNNNLLSTLAESGATVRGGRGGAHSGGGSSVMVVGESGGGSGLASMPHLEVLQLGFNQLTDLPVLRLHLVSSLKVLHLQGNELTRIDGLDGLLHLRELVLDRNKIKALEPGSLASLNNLRELRMEEVGLRSLSHFGPLPLLHALFLGGNRIAELIEIEKLSQLPSLHELVLANNPCARKPLYRATTLRKIPPLRVLDGRDVGPDERDRADLLLSNERPPQQNPTAMAALDAMRPNHKVPLKLTSLNFELMAGMAGAGPSDLLGLGGAGVGGSAPHSAGGLQGGGPGTTGSWNPLAGGSESFFLPAPTNKLAQQVGARPGGAGVNPNQGGGDGRRNSARAPAWQRVLDRERGGGGRSS